MRGAGLRLATLALVACLCGGAQAQDQTPATPLPSAVLTLDRDRLFAETLFGKAVEARIKAESDALVAENLRLETALEAEERDLTDRRALLPAEEFKRLAAAFDTKAEQIRAAQAAKSRAIAARRDSEQQRFLEAAVPVLGALMRERGAAAIFDKNLIVLSLRGIDITDAAIARIDEVLGSGDAPAPDPAAPTGTPAPALDPKAPAEPPPQP